MNDPLILICSGAYCDTELVAEFGKLPPSFLPVGHSRLYELQLDSLRQLRGRRLLSLPDSYDLPDFDRAQLLERGVEVVAVPENLRLGESIAHALQVAGASIEPVTILHGDTVVYDPPGPHGDVVAVSTAMRSYAWGSFDQAADRFRAGGAFDGTIQAVCGYFSFSSGVELRRSLALSRGDFIEALNYYKNALKLDLVSAERWLDFGHLQTFYSSRCEIRTQRAFNDLTISYSTVEKTSSDLAKIEAEAAWYENLPHELKGYVPAYLGRRGRDRAGYAVGYLPTPSLHELFVFGDLDRATWERVIASSFDFIRECSRFGEAKPAEPTLGRLTVEKTEARLRQFAKNAEFDLNEEWRYAGRLMPSIGAMAKNTACSIDLETTTFSGVMHGDMCFTNMFFDHRRQQIQLIDPRGQIDPASPSIYGDIRYDMAKLNHSIVGMYDFILAGRYECSGFLSRDVEITFPVSGSASFLSNIARQHDVSGRTISHKEIAAITVHLFLSMLPLHRDRPDRQKAFLANAYRLYAAHWE